MWESSILTYIWRAIYAERSNIAYFIVNICLCVCVCVCVHDIRILNAIFHGPDYLQACALVRERRAKETCDNAHDCLCYITLQRDVRMLPVTCVVAHLGKDREHISMMQSC